MKIKVGILQMEVLFGEPEKNRVKLEKLATEAVRKDVDILVFPEMWNIGFFPKNTAEIADRDGEPSRALLSRLARRLNVNIVGGSVADLRNGKVYNTTYVFNRSGRLVSKYDKVHLFSHSKEDQYFVAGDDIALFDLEGVRYGHLICYDLRFPELFRMLAVKGALVVFVPAQWPLSRKEHWGALLRARAIENQSYMVGVNASHVSAQRVPCGGGSGCFDPWGERLSEAGMGEEVITVELDMDVVNDVRERIDVFQDRRAALYKSIEQKQNLMEG